MPHFLVVCPYDSEEPHRIYYELYGSDHAPHKIIFTMGLGGTCIQWQPQVDYFKQFPDQYQLLIYDNRGMGLSDTVSGRWTTSKMAMDAIRLLQRLRWTSSQPHFHIHIVGLSMGGMISQELCRMGPQHGIHFKSLMLLSTIAGGLYSLYYFVLSIPTGLQLTARTFLSRDANSQIKNGLSLLYPSSFLDQEGIHPETGQPTVNFKIFRRALIKRGLADKQLGKPSSPSIVSIIKQGLAVFGHSVSQEEFLAMSRMVQGNILVLTGDEDILVHPANATRLSKELIGSELLVIPQAGHGANEQAANVVNQAIERHILSSSTTMPAKL